MKTFIKQTVSLLVRIFTRIDDQKLYWYDRGYNGSNLYFLRIDEYLKKLKYRKIYTSSYIKQNKNPLKNFKAVILDMIEFYQSKLIIHTHGYSYKRKKKQRIISIGHGIVLKSHPYYKYVERKSSLKAKNYIKPNQFNDYLVSTSKLATYFLNQFNAHICKNVIYTGYPRNDLLSKNKEISLINEFKLDSHEQIFICYAPTYRDKLEIEFWPSNPLFDDKIYLLEKFLTDTKKTMLIKPHPNEISDYKKLQSERIIIIDSNWLEKRKINFYSLLSKVDLLITDYSSIYIDFLLTDKPIIFFNYDLKAYEKNRVLMVDNYDNWTPGFKAQSIEELIKSIKKTLEEESFRDERIKLKNDFHIFQDFNSTNRFIEFLNSI